MSPEIRDGIRMLRESGIKYRVSHSGSLSVTPREYMRYLSKPKPASASK